MIQKLLFTLLFTFAALQGQAQENGAVCGTIFNDVNGDGILNEGEPGVPGIMIVMFSGPQSEDLFQYATTDENGSYCITGLSVGIYTFAIEVPEGWTINGSDNTFTVTITDDTVLNGYRYGVTATMAAPQATRDLFSVYPNPASSLLYINLKNPAVSGVVSFVDVCGKQLLSQAVYGTQTSVDISRLPAGVYIARMVARNSISYKKIVITK
ncbi:T9SS type A sorting domain-containing protein [Flavobacterium sp. RHBU_24]|uniref:T9SS type A sorting domain-containing protein n=1 Tax=Flavobacterium sp. RHBU_24 TaxID=3391185 RepID=UPI003984DF3B